MRFGRALFLVAGASLMVAAPAYAVDAAKPLPCGLKATDKTGDNVDQATQTPHNLDITGLFLKHDPAQGDDATTVNIQIAELNMDLPIGATGLTWTFQWNGADGVTRFVRAIRDITGNIAFEHGELVPPIGDLVLPRYEYRGPTGGAIFEGTDGVVQIVIPKEPDGLATKKLKSGFAQASENRQVVPNALATPTRGLSSPVDRIPDGEAFLPEYTVKTTTGCTFAAAPPAAPQGTAGAKATGRGKAAIKRSRKARRRR